MTCDRFSSVQSISSVQHFATPWTTARQASLSITNSQSLLELMSIESVMPSNHLILCHPLLLLPSTFPSIRVFSNESVLKCDRLTGEKSNKSLVTCIHGRDPGKQSNSPKWRKSSPNISFQQKAKEDIGDSGLETVHLRLRLEPYS